MGAMDDFLTLTPIHTLTNSNWSFCVTVSSMRKIVFAFVCAHGLLGEWFTRFMMSRQADAVRCSHDPCTRMSCIAVGMKRGCLAKHAIEICSAKGHL